MSIRKTLMMSSSLISLLVAAPSMASKTTVTFKETISQYDSLESVKVKKIKIEKPVEDDKDVGGTDVAEFHLKPAVDAAYSHIGTLKQSVVAHPYFQYADNEDNHKISLFAPGIKGSFDFRKLHITQKELDAFIGSVPFGTFMTNLLKITLQDLITKSQNELVPSIDMVTGMNVRFAYNRKNPAWPCLYIEPLNVAIPLYNNHRQLLFTNIVDYDALTPNVPAFALLSQQQRQQQAVTAEFIAKAFRINMNSAIKSGLMRRAERPGESIDEFWVGRLNVTPQSHYNQWQAELLKSTTFKRERDDFEKKFEDKKAELNAEVSSNAGVQRNIAGLIDPTRPASYSKAYDRYLLPQSKSNIQRLLDKFQSLNNDHANEKARMEINYRSQVQTLEANCNRLTNLKDQAEQSLNTEKVRKEQALEELEGVRQTIQQLSNQVAQTTQEKQALERSRQESQGKLERAEAKAKQAQEDYDKAEESKKNIQILLSNTEKEREEYKRHAAQKQIELEAHLKKTTQIQNELQATQSRVDKLLENKNELLRELMGKNQQLEQAINSNQSSQNKVADLQRQVQQLEQESKTLSDNLTLAIQSRDAAKNDLEQAELSMNQLHQENNDLKESAEQKQVEFNQKIKEITSKNIDLMAKLEQLDQKSMLMQAQNDEMINYQKQLLQQNALIVDQAEQKALKARNERDEAQAQLQKLESKMSKQKQEFLLSQQNIQDLESQLKKEREDNGKASSELEQKYKNAISARFDLSLQVEELKEKLRKARFYAKQKQQHLQDAEDDLNSSRLSILGFGYDGSSISFSNNSSPQTHTVQHSSLGNLGQVHIPPENDYLTGQMVQFQSNMGEMNDPLNFENTGSKSSVKGEHLLSKVTEEIEMEDQNSLAPGRQNSSAPQKSDNTFTTVKVVNSLERSIGTLNDESQESISAPLPYTWNQGQGHNVKFISRPAAKDGNCGYHALGIGRQDAAQLLLDNADREEIRRLVAPEIRGAVFTDQLPQSMREGDVFADLPPLMEKLNRSVAYYNQINGLQGDNSLSATQLIQGLRDNSLSREAEGIENLVTVIQALEDRLEEWSLLPETYREYVRHYVGGDSHNWLVFQPHSTSTLDALALLYDWNIRVLQPDWGKASTLYERHSANPGGSQTVHILYNGINHFDGLDINEGGEPDFSSSSELNIDPLQKESQQNPKGQAENPSNLVQPLQQEILSDQKVEKKEEQPVQKNSANKAPKKKSARQLEERKQGGDRKVSQDRPSSQMKQAAQLRDNRANTKSPRLSEDSEFKQFARNPSNQGMVKKIGLQKTVEEFEKKRSNTKSPRLSQDSEFQPLSVNLGRLRP